MGQRGPAPKPTELKRLAGNPGKRKLNEAEPKPLGVPSCPAWLSREAKAEWRRVLPELVRLGIIGKVDGAALAGYCCAYATFRQAEEAIQTHGLTFETGTGYRAQSPEVGIRSKALEQMMQYLSEFGMSPSSRSRIVTPPKPEPEDPMAEFLEQ
jgi:P27 family predicted phage terminase small subunit